MRNADAFKNYGIDEFLADPYFRSWVFEPDQKKDAFWEHFVDKYRNKKGDVEKAKAILLAMRVQFSKADSSPSEIESTFAGIRQKIKEPYPTKRRVLRRRSFIISTAAIIVLLLSVGIWFMFSSGTGQKMEFQTDYAEQRSVVLPDGSKVRLNANSKLWYYKNAWGDQDTRAVWLEGEAFFDVQKKHDTGVKFIVHAAGLNVEVLGTQFNVETRQEKTQVVLEEGHIKLNLKDNDSLSEVHMKPGEFAVYEAKEKELTIKNVETKPFTSWKDGVLIFDNVTLEEAAKRLEVIFGKEIRIERADLKNQLIRITVFSLEDINEFLKTVESIYEGEIRTKQVGNTITFY